MEEEEMTRKKILDLWNKNKDKFREILKKRIIEKADVITDIIVTLMDDQINFELTEGYRYVYPGMVMWGYISDILIDMFNENLPYRNLLQHKIMMLLETLVTDEAYKLFKDIR